MRNVWSLTAVLLATTLAGCAGSSEDLDSFDRVEAPMWAAGYGFAYNITGDMSGQATMTIDGEVVDDMPTNITLLDQEMMVIEILSANHTASEPVYIGIARFADGITYSMIGDSVAGFGKVATAIRQSDLSPMAVELSQAQVCDPGCRLTTAGMEVQEAVLDPYLDFPLTPGKTWRNDIPMMGELADYGGFMNLNSEVLGMQRVDGPDGPVDAVVIEHTLSLPFDDGSLEFFASQAGTGYDDIDIHVELDGGLTSYYAPSIGAVVQEVLSLDLLAEIAYTDDGQRYEFVARAATDVTQYLTAYSHEASEDLSGEALYDRFDDGLGVRTPGGEMLEGYDLQLSADRADFDLADGGDVTFTATTTPALRDGDAIRYSIVDGRGNVISTGSGDAFTETFEEAGLYGVYAQATNAAGTVQATRDLFIAADLSRTIELLCGHASASAVPNSGSCTSADIPIYNTFGLQEVTISSVGSTIYDTGASLIVTDGAGNEASTGAAGGTGSIGLTDLGALTIDPKGWSATWAADYAAEPQISIEMMLDYGAPSIDDASPQEGGDGLMAQMFRTALPTGFF